MKLRCVWDCKAQGPDDAMHDRFILIDRNELGVEVLNTECSNTRVCRDFALRFCPDPIIYSMIVHKEPLCNGDQHFDTPRPNPANVLDPRMGTCCSSFDHYATWDDEEQTRQLPSLGHTRAGDDRRLALQTAYERRLERNDNDEMRVSTHIHPEDAYIISCV